MKEITVDEILYEGRRYQLDKLLTLKVKEIKETEEACQKDSNSENFATSIYNRIPYHWNYSYDNNNYDNWNYSYYSYDNNNYYKWDYSYNYYNKKDK